MPMGLSISRYHAKPKLPTFLSVICLSELKCCEPKLPPLTSQLRPLEASASTLASLTLPGLAGLWACAEEPASIAIAAKKTAAMAPPIPDLFIGIPSVRRSRPIFTDPVARAHGGLSPKQWPRLVLQGVVWHEGCQARLAQVRGRPRVRAARGCIALYFSSATCTVFEPRMVRILARSASDWLAFSTEPSTWALTASSLPPSPSKVAQFLYSTTK